MFATAVRGAAPATTVNASASPSIPTFRFKEVTSTMDVAKDILRHVFPAGGGSSAKSDGTLQSLTLPNATPNELSGDVLKALTSQQPFVVTAELQTLGRGTTGRKWDSTKTGNMAMSLVVPCDALPMDLLPVLPLIVGVSAKVSVDAFVRRSFVNIATAQSSTDTVLGALQLKWPNDLLCDKKKMMGVLIEGEGSHMIIGVGMNLCQTPQIDSTDGSRVATCLRECVDRVGLATSGGDDAQALWNTAADTMLGFICKEVIARLGLPTTEGNDANRACNGPAARAKVVADFERFMATDVLMHKRVPAFTNTDGVVSTRGDPMLPTGLNSWGHLLAQNQKTGAVETLTADYLH